MIKKTSFFFLALFLGISFFISQPTSSESASSKQVKYLYCEFLGFNSTIKLYGYKISKSTYYIKGLKYNINPARSLGDKNNILINSPRKTLFKSQDNLQAGGDFKYLKVNKLFPITKKKKLNFVTWFDIDGTDIPCVKNFRIL
jgi:hypothetical protein